MAAANKLLAIVQDHKSRGVKTPDDVLIQAEKMGSSVPVLLSLAQTATQIKPTMYTASTITTALQGVQAYTKSEHFHSTPEEVAAVQTLVLVLVKLMIERPVAFNIAPIVQFVQDTLRSLADSLIGKTQFVEAATTAQAFVATATALGVAPQFIKAPLSPEAEAALVAPPADEPPADEPPADEPPADETKPKGLSYSTMVIGGVIIIGALWYFKKGRKA